MLLFHIFQKHALVFKIPFNLKINLETLVLQKQKIIITKQFIVFKIHFSFQN